MGANQSTQPPGSVPGVGSGSGIAAQTPSAVHAIQPIQLTPVTAPGQVVMQTKKEIDPETARTCSTFGPKSLSS